MADIRVLLDEISARTAAANEAASEQQTSRAAARRRAERIAEITAYAEASLNAPTRVGFVAYLYGGEHITGVVTSSDSGSFRVATTDGEKIAEIEYIESAGTYNV